MLGACLPHRGQPCCADHYPTPHVLLFGLFGRHSCCSAAPLPGSFPCCAHPHRPPTPTPPPLPAFGLPPRTRPLNVRTHWTNVRTSRVLQLLGQLQMSTIVVMAVGARLPQIWLNVRRGNAGVLSVATCVLNVAGCVVRIFTTLVLTGDAIILWGCATQLALNAVLLYQAAVTPPGAVAVAVAVAGGEPAGAGTRDAGYAGPAPGAGDGPAAAKATASQQPDPPAEDGGRGAGMALPVPA
jgi:hypothetical protein